MTRTLPRLLLLIILASSSVSAAVSHKVFHAASSSTPIVIAILADHYTDEVKFENDVKNFITYGLLAHPYYAAHASDLQIETFFDAVTGAEISKYGFNVEVPSQNCVLSWEVGTTPTTNTAMKVSAVVSAINPRHTIVIGDHPYSIGCTDGEWTYVTEDAAGSDMLAHELGHGIGQLHDEWWLAPNKLLPHPGLSADPEIARNCHHQNSGATPTPPWTFPGAGSYPGCDLYGAQVVHPYDHMTMYGAHKYCLMGATSNAEFCPVCRHYMDQEFAYIENPDIANPDPGHRDPENPDTHNPDQQRPAPPTGLRIVPAAFVLQPAPGTVKPEAPLPPVQPPIATLKPAPPGTPRPIVRLVVLFDPTGGGITARRGLAITARYAPSYRRLGEYAYEILDGDRTIEVGVLPSSLFRSKGYQGGAGHTTSDPKPTEVTIQLPDLTSEQIKSRNIGIRIWWLSPAVRDKLITPSVLANLRTGKQVEPRGSLSVEQIRSVM